VRGARGYRGGESRGDPPRATVEIADQLRPSGHVVEGLRRGETKAATARASDLATGTDAADASFESYHTR